MHKCREYLPTNCTLIYRESFEFITFIIIGLRIICSNQLYGDYLPACIYTHGWPVNRDKKYYMINIIHNALFARWNCRHCCWNEKILSITSWDLHSWLNKLLNVTFKNYLAQVLGRTPNWQDREIWFSISNNRWEYDKSKSLSFIPKLLKFWHFLDHFDIFLHFLIRVHLPDWGWDSISGGFKLPEVQLKCIFKGNPILSFGSDIKPLNSPRDFKI